jgi:hypothetical protein
VRERRIDPCEKLMHFRVILNYIDGRGKILVINSEECMYITSSTKAVDYTKEPFDFKETYMKFHFFFPPLSPDQ